MIVMGLGGLWHGAGTELFDMGTFTRRSACDRAAICPLPRPYGLNILRAVRTAVVFLCVSILWIFFKFAKLRARDVLSMGHVPPQRHPKPAHLSYALAVFYTAPVIIQHLAPTALLNR